MTNFLKLKLVWITFFCCNLKILNNGMQIATTTISAYCKKKKRNFFFIRNIFESFIKLNTKKRRKRNM